MARIRARIEPRTEKLPPQQGPVAPSRHMMRLRQTPEWQSAVQMYNDLMAKDAAKSKGGRPRKEDLKALLDE